MMRDSAVDVTVKTRFASAESLMQVVSTGIERGALRLPTQLPAGRTFEVALLTAAGELAIRGSCEVVRADGEATLVRFLSATDDGENRDAWVDLDDAVVMMSPTMAAEALLRPRPRERSDWAGALGTPMPPSMPAARVAIPPLPPVRGGGPEVPPVSARPRRQPAAVGRAATLPLEPPASNAPVPPPTVVVAPEAMSPPPVAAPPAAAPPVMAHVATPHVPSPSSGTTAPPPMGTTVPPPTGTTIPPPMMAMWGAPAGYYFAPAPYDAAARMRPTTLPPGWGPEQGRMWIPVDAAPMPVAAAPMPVATPAPAPAPNRAARGMLAASIFIAAAGAAVAVSAVWWARSVSAQRGAPSAAPSSAPAPVAALAATPPPSVQPAAAVAPAPAPPPALVEPPPTPVPAVEAVAPPPDPTTEPTPAAVVAPAVDAAPARCDLAITTNADGATIFVDGHRRGEAPATIDVPCGATEIALRHPRYQEQVRTLTPADQSSLHLTLSRPRAQLRVVTRPSGATVKIGGRVVGKSPLVAPVDGFERISVTLTGAGFATETRSVYAKGGTNVLAVTLKKK